MRLMRDLVGETLSERYRIVARIAGGGMGEVYRGHDLLLDRPVAIKVLQPTLANDPDLVARFRAEARAAARLSHPNVVAVHDWGQEDDRTYYMIMEYVAGTDLRDIIVGRGPFDPAHAAEIAIAICEALHAAHETGLVHRDVKPENVLIDREGKVKVADFGIAAVTDAERTMPGGSILGTLRYLSPEQARGLEASRASDLWAAGAVFFELLTGSAPSGGSGAELLRRRSEEEPVAPSSLEPAVPSSMDEVVLKACALEPADRFENAQAMADAIRAAAQGLERKPRPVKELLVDLTEEIALPNVTPTEFEGREAYLQRRRRKLRRRIGKVLLAVLLAAGLAFGATEVVPALLGPQEVDVPVVATLTLAEAREIAEEAGVELEVVEEIRHETIPEGSIVSQEPSGGTILEGEAISIVVSKGPPLVKVPKLTGTSFADATDRLDGLGLLLGEVTYEYSTEQAVDEVIRVEAPSKRIEKGSRVDLVVSKGPRSVLVPDVVGKTAERARSILEAAGFEVIEVSVFDDEVPEGRVVATNPEAEMQADEASRVQISVSQGPEFKPVTMPDVRNMNVDRARARLESLGLRVTVRQSCPGSTVVETSPFPGEKIHENDRVILFVC